MTKIVLPPVSNLSICAIIISAFISRKGLGGGESPEHDGGDFQLDADMSPR